MMKVNRWSMQWLKIPLRWLIITAFILVDYSYGKADFQSTPEKQLFVVKGETAKFVWNYTVDNKASEFNALSPKWFIIINGEKVFVGRDNVYDDWKFNISDSCPLQFLNPLRVSRESQATLVIQKVIHKDSGTYGCQLSLRSGSDKISEAELIVTDHPTFTVNPNAITEVIEHDNLSINCTAVGPPPPNIRWLNVTSGKNATHYGKGSVILSVQKVKRYLNGTQYKCVANNNPNAPDVESSTTTVIVNYPPDFTMLPSNTTVTQGDTIYLHCQATGNPAVSALWPRGSGVSLKDGHEILGNGTLVIQGAVKTDAGMYCCRVQNFYSGRLHNQTACAFVTVRYQPNVTCDASDIVVKEGEPVAMRCKAEGYPKPTIKWSNLSGPSESRGEWYNISSVSKSDAGTYTCTATNSIGNDAKAYITVTVQYKPIIDTFSSNTTANSWNGNTITLKCKYSEALPKPAWIWKKPNGENINSSVIKNNDNWSEMTVTTGQESSDYGTYKCIAENDAGKDQHEINVTQLYAPGQVNFTITNQKAVSVTVSWTKPVYDGGTAITGYKLEIHQIKTKLQKNNIFLIDVLKETKTVTGLVKSTHYIVKLYAKNVVGYGNVSTKNFTTKKQGPPASPLVNYIYVPPLSVSLTWSKPDENGGEITSYTIYKKVSSIDSKWKQVGQIYGSPLTYTVKKLQPGTTYQFIVTATNMFGESVKDDSKGKSVEIPVVTTASKTLAPIDGSKDESTEPSDPNQPIIIAGAVVAVVLILVTVIISVIILKKKNIFGKAKRKSARTENAAYHNDVHSDDSSGRQAAVIDLGDASATYAAVDTSKKTKNKPKEIATYAAVDKSKKKKKPGEIIYAELADFNTNYTPAENRPVKYLETDYADISQFQSQSEPEPTYANFPGRSKDYANVSDI